MTGIQDLAESFALLYRKKAALKTKRNSLRCSASYHSEGWPPCWSEPTEEQCDNCKARAVAHEELMKISRETQTVCRRLFRAIDKIPNQ